MEMTIEQAKANLDQAIANIPTTRENHAILINSLNLLVAEAEKKKDGEPK